MTERRDNPDHPDAMTCRELVELVTEYLEETMSAADRTRLERHLEKCPGCVNSIDQMRQTIGILGRVPREELPEKAWSELSDLFRNWKKGS